MFKILFSSSKKSFFFISFILFLSTFSFIFTWNIIYSVENFIKDTSKDFIWADLNLSSDKIDLFLQEDYLKEKYNPEFSKKISLQTSIFYNNSPELYSINYIEKNYPFYWNFDKVEVNKNWELIVSKKVYDKFWDEKIEVLWKKYSIWYYLEEDFLADFNPFWWNDIYLNIEEFDKEKLKNLSRVDYNLLLKTSKVKEIESDKILKNLEEKKELKINSEETSNKNLNGIISRLNLFIQIFYQIIIVLTFFIIIVNFESYFKKVIKNIKILNILWYSNYKIIFNFFTLFLIISILSSLLAYLLVYLIFQNIDFISLQMDISLIFKSIFIWFLIILSWSFLNLIKLKATSINNFESDNFYKKSKKYTVFYLIFLILILFLISYFSGVDLLSSIFSSVWFIILTIILIILINFITKKIFNLFWKKLKKNFYIFDAFRSTVKPWNLSILIVFSTIISLSWFIIFSTFSNWFIDFLNKTSEWKIDTFVINLNSDDLEQIKKDFSKDEYFEIIRARISKINWKKLKDFLETDKVSGRFSREFNVTTRNLDDTIIEWNSLKNWEVWVDKNFAKSLWIKLWDKIEFLVLWLKKELLVTQIRESEIRWASPFFYFNYYKEDFKWFSTNYFLSYDSKSKWENFNKKLSEKLWEQATFINIWNIIDKIKSISDYVLYFVYTILSYITIFSIITFIVSVNFLKSFKTKKIETYNKFWAIISKMQKSVFYEYIYLIILGLIISAFIALLISIFVFYLNPFIDFKLIFFLKSLFISILFIWFYIIMYRIFGR